MNSQTVTVAKRDENGLMQLVSKGAIFQPETRFKGGTVPWFDDNTLLKEGKSSSEVR